MLATAQPGGQYPQNGHWNQQQQFNPYVPQQQMFYNPQFPQNQHYFQPHAASTSPSFPSGTPVSDQSPQLPIIRQHAHQVPHSGQQAPHPYRRPTESQRKPSPQPPHKTEGSSKSSTDNTRPSPRNPPTSVSAVNATAGHSPSSSTSSAPNVVPKPSPLSQSTPVPVEKPGRLSGRLRRALSSNALSDGDIPVLSDADADSTAAKRTKPKSRAASLFSSRLNGSTDNLSLSSTMSSFSTRSTQMIRKIGTLGKAARRSSLAGISSLFKDKEGKQSKGRPPTSPTKGTAVQASVSHVTAELEPLSVSLGDSFTSEMRGLSPAEQLVRQHTLKSDAEAAAARREASERRDATERRLAATNPEPTPVTWEKNTMNTPTKQSVAVNEDGTRGVFVEDEIDEDEGENGQDYDVTIRPGDLDENEYIAQEAQMRRNATPAKGILKHAGTYNQQTYNVQVKPDMLRKSSSKATLTLIAASSTSSRQLSFANNLSVYDTWSATLYDRRSEPATWSRLTPQLAQRIKEELNSYKMEEMDIHVSSRVYTQFFV